MYPHVQVRTRHKYLHTQHVIDIQVVVDIVVVAAVVLGFGLAFLAIYFISLVE